MEDMKKIDLTKRVTIVSTGKSIYMPEKGKEYNVSPLHAETLVKSGKATYKTTVQAALEKTAEAAA